MREKKYADIGKNNPADEFLKACNKVSSPAWTSNPAKPERLINGALQAFREGRPGNIQTLLLNAKSLEEGGRFCNIVPFVLSKISEESDDKLADINLALEKIPDADRESVLSNALKTAVSKSIGEEPFFALLWQAGASFDVALSNMHARQDCDQDDIGRVTFFQKKITGKPAAGEAAQPAAEEVLPALVDIVRRMQDQMRIITEEVSHLKSQAPQDRHPLPRTGCSSERPEETTPKPIHNLSYV